MGCPVLNDKSIVVVGPGAMGTMITALLMLSGRCCPVLLDHNQERAARLDSTLFTLELQRTKLSVPIQVTAEPGSLAGVQTVLLCVKSFQVDDALSFARPILKDDTLVVFLQNGMSHLPAAAELAGQCPVALAVTALGSTLIAPGHVRHGGSGITRMGSFPKPATAQSEARLESLAACLTDASLETRTVSAILDWVWLKLLVNVGINPLTVVLNCPNGGLLQSTAARSLMEAAVKEGETVARAEGITLPEDPLARTIQVCRDTAANISSMLQDVRAPRRTEIESITGEIVKRAAVHGIPVPVNRDLLDQVRKCAVS